MCSQRQQESRVHLGDWNWVRFRFLCGRQKSGSLCWSFIHSTSSTESLLSWWQAQCKVLEVWMEVHLSFSLAQNPFPPFLMTSWLTSWFSFGKPLIPYSCFIWFLPERLALHPVPQDLHQAQALEGYLVYPKFLVTVLCMRLKKSNQGLPWNYQEDEDLSPMEAEAVRMWSCL